MIHWVLNAHLIVMVKVVASVVIRRRDLVDFIQHEEPSIWSAFYSALVGGLMRAISYISLRSKECHTQKCTKLVTLMLSYAVFSYSAVMIEKL